MSPHTQAEGASSLDGVRLTWIGQIALLVVDRPAQRNALSRGAMAAFALAVNALERAQALRAVIVTGAGDAFIAGGDLRDLHGLTTAAEGEAMARAMQGALDALSALPVPVIAAIEGYAVGGGVEVALAADQRVLGDGAYLSFKQIEMAVATGWGGAWRLTRLVGPARALNLLWTGASLRGEEAQRLGLVDLVAGPGERALDRALLLAHELVARPQHVLLAMKRLVLAASCDAAEHRELEAKLFGETWGHPAHAEAVARFLAGRR